MGEAVNDRRRPTRVLLVDDDPSGVRLLERYLAPLGYAVRAAHGAREALYEIEAWLPDVVLLDVVMPDASGLEVCEAIKSDPRTARTQVMLVTALDDRRDVVTGIECGADDYVTKPVDRELFVAKVRALVRVSETLERLESAREQLAARTRELELKKTLAQTIVHDLRSPLTALLGNLDLIAMQTSSDRRERIGNRARQSARRLHRMIEDLLDVECLEEGVYALERPGRIGVAPIAEEAIEELRPTALASDVELVMDVADPGAAVEGDADLLLRVVDNLLRNAIAHAPKGTQVRLEIAGSDDAVVVTVSDEGAGIPRELRETIFDKYASIAPRKGGIERNRGLGLTFCRLAVEAHGGEISVEDVEGSGARFRVEFPAAESGVAEEAFVSAPPSDDVGRRSHGAR